MTAPNFPGRPVPLIGRRIRELRKARRWSGQKVSDLTGGAISRSSIADIELGRAKDISLTAAIAIARIFDISVESLVDEHIPPTAYAIAHEITAAKNRLDAVVRSRTA